MLFVPQADFEIFDEDTYFDKMSEVESVLGRCCNNGHFKSFDGNNIYYEYYIAENAKANIVLVHGYTEFSKKYHELCFYLLNSGFNVFLYDQRGHGLSCRTTENIYVNHVNKFDEYVCDLDCYIKTIVEPNQGGLPMYIYSHSMGGAVAALYLAGHTHNIEKAILSSPMIYPVCTPLPSKILRHMITGEAKKNGWETKFRFSSDFNPDITFEENKSDLSKSRFLYNIELRKNESMYQNSASSNRWNYEVLGVKDTIFKNCTPTTLKTKVYIISVADDKVVKEKPQKKLARKLKCKFDTIQNARHTMITAKKPELTEYLKMITDFYCL